MKRILVGVDGSESSKKATRLAVDIALRFGAKVILAHVVPRLTLPPDVYGLTPEDVERQHVAYGEKLLADALAEIAQPEVTLDTAVLLGDPAESLAQAADAESADLIVVGSRGRGAVARIMVGSVSDRLVHIGNRPVLVVH